VADRRVGDADLTCSKVQNRAVQRVHTRTHTHTHRFDAQHGADREVQRILLELLNQMDGFDQSVNVKVIMATNRHDTLDPALLRPGYTFSKVPYIQTFVF